MLVVLSMGVLLLLVVALGAALFRTTYTARESAAPFYMTPKGAIREALREVGLERGQTFYDLGAGTGRALLIAEREFGARAVGYELSWFFYLVSKINLAAHGSKAKIIYGNFWDANLRDADVVFCFLAIRTMEKMEEKFRRELKPGTRIIVYAFPLPTITPQKTITVHGEWKMFLYKT